MHAALDSQTKLKVRDVITEADSMYNELKDALTDCGTLTFSHAAENIMTAERGKLTTLPVRQVMQKCERLLEKMVGDARTVREACTSFAVAIVRYNTNADLKQYLDIKGSFSKELFCRSIEEWLANKPGSTWGKKQEYVNPSYERQPNNRFQKPGLGKKQGTCYYCGKAGHYSQECRARLASEKPTSQQPSLVVPVVKREPGMGSLANRDMAEVTCFRCRQKGHKSTHCPLKTNRIKKINVPADRMIPLRKNEDFGTIGDHQLPITCDTGAEVTVVPAECVLPHQLTGETCELKAFNQTKSEGQWCNIELVIDQTVFCRKAVTQPGATLGWSACLSLDMADEREGQFLLHQMKKRATLSDDDIQCLPPEVKEGALLSGVLARDANVVKGRDKSASQKRVVVTESREEDKLPVQSTVVEADSEETKESMDGRVDVVGKEREVVLDDEKETLVLAEESGESLGGSVQEKGAGDLSVEGIRSDIPRADLALATEKDESLAAIYKLGLNDKEGYHVVEGLLFRTRLDMFGDPKEQLCMPAE